MKKIFRLTASGQKALSLYSCDGDYFISHFNGERLSFNWSPPDFKILGKSYPVLDFVSWALGPLVISEKAMKILQPIISQYVQIFFMATIKKKLFVVNVIQVDDCLDCKNSEIIYAIDNPHKIIRVDSVVIDKNKISGSPIFKIKQDPVEIFVDETFVKIVIENKLKGAHFSDPADSGWFISTHDNINGIVT